MGLRAQCARAAGWLGAAAVTGAAVGWLNHTGGYAVAPGGLLECPLHATTGLWCPFCGGLRCVAALSHGDLLAAASFNLLVLTLGPVVILWWTVGVRAAWAGRPHPWPLLTNRRWLVVGGVLLAFAVWRNVPALPLGAYLGP
jgi:Protein of unknown function (DUF2752)